MNNRAKMGHKSPRVWSALARIEAVRAATILVAALALYAATPATAQSQRTSYSNPVIAGDYPDPSVIRVGEDYWAATTTGTWAPHFSLLRSRDLVNWHAAGYVFRERPAWAKSDFWAPELVHDGGRFFVYYVARRDEGPKKSGTLCVGVAVAPGPGGPYTDRGPLVCEIKERRGVGSIDPDFVRDERGEPYLVWKADGNDAEPDEPTSIFAQPLSEDGTKLVGKRKEILRNTAPWERNVTEGSFVLRRGEWFYHFYSGNACCGRACDYALGVARAKKLLGPWEKNPANPIVAANADWQCPGHGSIVSTPDGRDFLLYHSYRKRRDAFNVGREAVLDEVAWGADGWPSINAGRGPSTNATAPLGVSEVEPGEFFDDFDAAQLAPEWQWPMDARQSARVEPEAGGRLVLEAAQPLPGDQFTGAAIARRTTSGDYTATALVALRGAAAGARAGLSAYSWREWSVGVAVGGGKVTVWRREGKDLRTPASADVPAVVEKIYLRMRAEGGERYRFAYSADGRAWNDLGGEVDGSYIEGARVALVAGGVGAARFDWIRITQNGR
ncbi:MAG: xylan 1,4-beta-xylosidase [Acidobacteriota bacterium]|nr:xylan 1,4-beta-xylosidase [Acidobacteriota bacterium]